MKITILMLVTAIACGQTSSLGADQVEDGVLLRIVVGDRYGEQPSIRNLSLVLRSVEQSEEATRIIFEHGSSVEITLPSGLYQVSTERAVQWGDQWVMWDVEVPVTEAVNELQLGYANAITFDHRPEEMTDSTSEKASVVPRAAADETSESKPKIPRPSAQGPVRDPESASEVTENSVVDVPTRQSSAVPDFSPGVDLSSPATPMEAAIVQVLQRWVLAVEQRDLDTLMSCYAPKLAEYFFQNDVSWEEVKLDKKRFFSKYPDIKKLEIRDVRITRTPEGMKASLTKSWEFGGEINFSGEAVSKLAFENINGRWLISSEREREVWVSRLVDQSDVALE